MLERKERDRLKLFINCSLRPFTPDDQLLARVDPMLWPSALTNRTHQGSKMFVV